jgi:hypothetical protein
MIEHPAWQPAGTGHARLVRSGEGLWLATTGPDGITLACVAGQDDTKPALTVTDPADLPTATPAPLRRTLTRLGPVQRLANPWLWDAVTTAILRQVVRAGQARKLYRAWRLEHGTTAPGVPAGLAIAPDPTAVLELTDTQFAETGAKFHREALRAAATAYLKHADQWRPLPAAGIAEALQDIARIGPWTARAAAADYTGDFSIYPHGDLAVRTWARNAAPELAWPDKDRPFEKAWTQQAASTVELHTLTQLTLSLGSHDLLSDLEHPARP